ncbi:Di-copper centre-containing protein [Colletotrichum falcatum]|nr:Di-copper centre-containing protein [Colletotrichum falcatum]
MVSLSKLTATVAACILPALAEAQRPGRGPPGRGPPGRGPPGRGPPGPPSPGPPPPGPPGPGPDPPAPGPPDWFEISVPVQHTTKTCVLEHTTKTCVLEHTSKTCVLEHTSKTCVFERPPKTCIYKCTAKAYHDYYNLTPLRRSCVVVYIQQAGTGVRIAIWPASGAQWDLYILGLAAMQRDAPENDMLSYFQISGIHGRPYIPWNGVDAVSGGSGRGYCPHGNVQFPMWHRPYVALFEQVLGNHIQAIAANYSGSRAQEYKTAADNWRHPYWDWAADGGAQLPAVATQATITVNGPGGQVQLANPLVGYKWQKFPLNTASNYFPTSGDRNCWGFPVTTRWPDSNGNNRPSLANQELSQDDLKANTYNVFTSATDYETMASTQSSGNSFEDVHNSVHSAIYAVMAYIEYSAFDPLFMLHHANVDRLIAMWQAIHYNDKTQTETLPSGGLFATAANTPITADSPLKPFYRDTSGNFHTGRTATDIKNFGYSYPEITDWNQSPDALARQVTVSVNRLYGPGGASKKLKARRQHRRSGCNGQKDQTDSHSSPVTYQAGAPHKRYTALVDLERSELPVPCSVYVYVDGELAGKINVMSMPTSGVMHSTVSLNTALEKLGKSMKIQDAQGEYGGSAINNGTEGSQPAVSPDDEEIIQKQLSVEIKSINGTIVPVSSAPSLKMKVELQHVAPPLSEDRLPIIVSVAAGPLAQPVDLST